MPSDLYSLFPAMNPSSATSPVEQAPLYKNHIPDRPLFGESTRRGRLLNLIVGTLASVFVAVTFICACASQSSFKAVNVYFSICICLVGFSHLVLIYWYRQGDVDPKFRFLIYFNAFTIFLLCICANVSFFRKLECTNRTIS
ncbi:transmembrane protein 243-like isoform X1 [Tachypleus tridentatus]|uniref:transmembrane protein 243-like isoform X1 n=2 Tax=Tachypleus tridentatus TaxID=6853 RepID=UPI003FD547B2